MIVGDACCTKLERKNDRNKETKLAELVYRYIILSCVIKISWDFFEMIKYQTHKQTYKHAIEKNISSKTKF